MQSELLHLLTHVDLSLLLLATATLLCVGAALFALAFRGENIANNSNIFRRFAAFFGTTAVLTLIVGFALSGYCTYLESSADASSIGICQFYQVFNFFNFIIISFLTYLKIF